MAVIATLAANVTARTSKFEKGMKRASRSLRKFTSSVAATGIRAAKMGAGLAAVAAGGITLMTRQASKSIDAIAKTSDKLGIATEALVGLQHAAQLAGVNVRTLHMGLQRLVRRVAEAGKGLGEAQGALKDLGLDAKHLATLSPDKQFQAIANAMEAVGSQGERVRLGFKLFDSEGVALINVLRGGSKALQAAQRDAMLLGQTFSRIDAAKVEMANNAFLRMRGFLSGVFRTFSIQLAPFMEAFVTRMVKAGTEGRNFGLTMVNGLEKAALGVAHLVGWLDKLRAELLLVQAAAVKRLDVGMKRFETGFRAGSFSIEFIRAIVGKKLFDKTPDFKRLADSFNAVGRAARGPMADVTDLIDKAAEAMKRFRDESALRSIKKAFKDIRENAQKMAEAMASSPFPQMAALGGRDAARRTQRFREIDLRRFAVAGIKATQSRPQVVTNPKQLAATLTTNQLLKLITQSVGMAL